jgi:rhomboid family GlyGly-CTERM serine protease
MKLKLDPKIESLPLVSIAVGLFALAAFVIPSAHRALIYDRTSVMAGEWWRFFTCHLVHFTKSHVFWDTLTFVVLAAAIELASRFALLVFLTISSLLIPTYLLLARPDVATYGGLSGIDSGLFVLIALLLIKGTAVEEARDGVRLAQLLLFLFVAKTVYEYATGDLLFVSGFAGEFTPLPASHVMGAVAGFLAAWLGFSRPSREDRREENSPAGLVCRQPL